MMYRFGGNSRVAVVTDRAGPCTATMSSDTSDGGAPLYSPAEPPKEAQSWSSMRLAAVQAREHHRSGAAEITVSRLAEVPAPTLGQDQKVTKLETRTDPSDLGTLNTASNPSPPQIAATKDNCQGQQLAGTTGVTNTMRASLGDVRNSGNAVTGTPRDISHEKPVAFSQQEQQHDAHIARTPILVHHAGMEGGSEDAAMRSQVQQAAVKQALDMYSEQQAAMKHRNRGHTYAVRQPNPGADAAGFQGNDQHQQREQRSHAAKFSRPGCSEQQGWGSDGIASRYGGNGDLKLNRQARGNGNSVCQHVSGATVNLNPGADTHNPARYGQPPIFSISAATDPAGDQGARLQSWREANNGTLNNGIHGRRDESSVLVHPPLPPIPEFIQQPHTAQKRSIIVFQPASKEVRDQRSHVLNSIVPESGKPDEAVLLHPDNFPFLEPAVVEHNTQEHGVIHISNVPFDITRAEVIAFVGRNSQILNDKEEPVHIIMDRVSSKTNDVYVELASLQAAINVVERLESNLGKGRPARLGNRPVDVSVSSPAKLMHDLFPVARGIMWNGFRPEFKAYDPQWSFENFQTFVSAEEMVMLVKHVENPTRSPFSKDSPERPYECMISTLKKMPWYMTDHITIKQRWSIFEACCRLIDLLQQSLNRRVHEARLTEQLLKRFTDAVMLCPGFTVQQKDSIASKVQMPEIDLKKFNMPRFPDSWCHQYALGPKPGAPLDVIEYYIAIIREETTRLFNTKNIGQKQALMQKHHCTDGYWGFFWCEVDYPEGPAFDDLTLAQAADREWTAIDTILRRALENHAATNSHRFASGHPDQNMVSCYGDVDARQIGYY